MYIHAYINLHRYIQLTIPKFLHTHIYIYIFIYIHIHIYIPEYIYIGISNALVPSSWRNLIKQGANFSSTVLGATVHYCQDLHTIS